MEDGDESKAQKKVSHKFHRKCETSERKILFHFLARISDLSNVQRLQLRCKECESGAAAVEKTCLPCDPHASKKLKSSEKQFLIGCKESVLLSSAESFA